MIIFIVAATHAFTRCEYAIIIAARNPSEAKDIFLNNKPDGLILEDISPIWDYIGVDKERIYYFNDGDGDDNETAGNNDDINSEGG